MTTDFFFEIPSFEELQDSKISPRRGEVGRHTLGAFGGFLLAFFYRASFGFFTQQIPLFVEKLQKLSPRGLLTTSRVEESDSPRKVLHTFDEAIPPEVDFLEKKHVLM